MRLPSMKYADRITKSQQVKFGGLDHRRAASDGQLWDMKNLTSDQYPAMAVRAPRMFYKKLDAPGGLYSWKGLCWVDGDRFFFNGKDCGQLPSAGSKTFASLGSWIVILPDKYCFHVETKELRPMEAKWEGNSLKFDNQSQEVTANTIIAPETDWEEYFSVGDAVKISGCKQKEKNNTVAVITGIEGNKLHFTAKCFALNGTDNNESYEEQGSLSISRSMPDLKWLCENENRLWGCDGDMVYGCGLGNVFIWELFDGVADNSWNVDTGSAGDFCGCATYGGHAIFFKEERIFKLYGAIPSDFELMGSATLGIEEGSGASLAVAGETLFYLSRSGVVAYNGGVPSPVSEVFGTERYRDAVAGSDGLKYYISMKGQDGKYRLYVFDTQLATWHIEDETRVTHFARHDGNLYYLNDKGEIWITGTIQDPPEGAQEEGAVEWMAEFTDFTEEDPNKKGLSKLQLRLDLEEGATAQVWLQFDSDGQWMLVSTLEGEGSKRSYYLPIVPRRCDHYRVKLTGTGGCRIYSMVREFYSGSELKSKTGRN